MKKAKINEKSPQSQVEPRQVWPSLTLQNSVPEQNPKERTQDGELKLNPEQQDSTKQRTEHSAADASSIFFCRQFPPSGEHIWGGTDVQEDRWNPSVTDVAVDSAAQSRDANGENNTFLIILRSETKQEWLSEWLGICLSRADEKAMWKQPPGAAANKEPGRVVFQELVDLSSNWLETNW